jgi:hypothetical protein
MQADVPWEDMERLRLRAAAQRLLPLPTAENLLKRNIIEELSPSIAAHTLARAADAYPHTAAHTLQPSGDRIIVCCDSRGDAEVGAELPCCTSFGAYVAAAIAGPSGVAPAELPARAYPISAQQAASIAKESKQATVSETTWVRTAGSSITLQGIDGAQATFVAAPEPRVALHCAHGLHATVQKQQHSDGLALTVSTPTGCMVTLDSSGAFIFRRSSSQQWCAVLPGGCYITGDLTNRVQAWLADGSQLEGTVTSAGGAALRSWLATAPDGSRTVLPSAGDADALTSEDTVSSAAAKDAPASAVQPAALLEAAADGAPETPQPLMTAVAIDRDIGARVVTRSDNSQRIEYLSGDAIEMRADGSRLTVYASGEWLLEAPELTVVRGSAVQVACALQPGATLVWRAEGSTTALQQSEGLHAVCSSGALICGARP